MSRNNNAGAISMGLAIALLAGVAAASAQTDLESASGSIQGVVINESGEPIASAIVYGLPEQDMRKRVRAVSDEQGGFVLKDVPAGLVYVSAFKESEGYPDNFFAFFKATGREIVQVGVERGRRAEHVLIQLGPKGASLTIRITQADGTPLTTTADIKFVRDDVPGVFSTKAGSPDYTMLVPSAPFRFSVEAPGYTPWHSQLITPHPGEILAEAVRLSHL